MPAGRVVIREVVVPIVGSDESADIAAAATPSAVAVVDPALPAAAVAVPSVAVAATASVAAAAAPTVVVAVVFRCVTALVDPAVAADCSVVDVAAPRARRDAPSAVVRRRFRTSNFLMIIPRGI